MSPGTREVVITNEPLVSDADSTRDNTGKVGLIEWKEICQTGIALFQPTPNCVVAAVSFAASERGSAAPGNVK